MTATERIRALVNRLSRLDAAETWADDLNPTQVAALEYLSRANRFSRAPSQVAAYMGTTRGTMSQTLKALERKGYVVERRSATDKRSISYALTDRGDALAARTGALSDAIETLSDMEKRKLQEGLSTILTTRLAANGGRAFGMCKTCAHHRKTEAGAFCALLSLPLEPDEALQICHEHIAA